jgi:hypothetical protein
MIGANRYFRVRRQFPLEAKVGARPSNVWIGASQVLQTTYATVTAKRGEEVHQLVGGTFLVRRSGEVLEVQTRRREAFEVMLHPAPAMPGLPLESLLEIPVSKATPVRAYRGAK